MPLPYEIRADIKRLSGDARNVSDFLMGAWTNVSEHEAAYFVTKSETLLIELSEKIKGIKKKVDDFMGMKDAAT